MFEVIQKSSVTFGRLELFLDFGIFILEITDEANVFILFISRHSWVLFRRVVDLIPVFYNVGLHSTFLVAKTAVQFHLHWSSSSCLSRWKIFHSFVPLLLFLVVFGRTTYSISPHCELFEAVSQFVARFEALLERMHLFLFNIINRAKALPYICQKARGFLLLMLRKFDDSSNWPTQIIFYSVNFCGNTQNGYKFRY